MATCTHRIRSPPAFRPYPPEKESQGDQLIHDDRMIVPGPEIEKGIRDAKKQHRSKPDSFIKLKAPQNRPESKSRNDIDKDLGLYQRKKLRPQHLEKQGRDQPVHASQRRSIITKRQLPLTHTIGTLPGKEDIYPVWKMNKKRNTGE